MFLINALTILLMSAPGELVGVTPVIATEAERTFGFGHTGDNSAYIQKLRAAVLPVNFIEFNGVKKSDHVVISWKTVSEENNSHFILKRSSDGNNFYDVVRINGKGTSSVTSAYGYIDKMPFVGENYYQLEQVDLDGEKSFSKVISVDFKLESLKTYSFFSADGNLNLVITADKQDDQAKLSIYDASGQSLVKQNLPLKQGVNQFSIKDFLKPGLLVISIVMKDRVITTKTIKY